MSKVNVPDDIYQKALDFAKAQQVSVDDVFTSAFMEHLAAWNRLKEQAARGSREEFLAVLDRVPAVEPEEHDRI